MAEYRCTWWEATGRRTPFNEHGIASMIYRRLDTGEEMSELPIGALLACRARDYGSTMPKGPDGRTVVCIIPSSHGPTWWFIDSRANNCTRPDDDKHRCWIRHGTVGEVIHVDKAGDTCAAGAGSIAVPGFHGFLHHGVLRST